MGKSTVCRALMAHFPKGVHIAVDDIREWVVSGISHPMDWNEETVQQFVLAENAAADAAIRYQEAGFAVAIDGCRRLPALDELALRMSALPLVKVVLTTTLEENLVRNRTRTGKTFAHEELIGLIEVLNPHFHEELKRGCPDWLFVDTTELDAEGAVIAILSNGFTGK